MTGAGVRLDGAGEALKQLAAAAARSEHPRPMFDLIGVKLARTTRERFDAGVSPEGNPWPPSIRALAGGGKTLIDSGRLMRSVTHNASDRQVEIGTNVLYAAIHQFGGTIRAKSGGKLAFRLLGRPVFVDEVTIPARPYLGIDEADEREIIAIAEDYVGGVEARSAQ